MPWLLVWYFRELKRSVNFVKNKLFFRDFWRFTMIHTALFVIAFSVIITLYVGHHEGYSKISWREISSAIRHTYFAGAVFFYGYIVPISIAILRKTLWSTVNVELYKKYGGVGVFFRHVYVVVVSIFTFGIYPLILMLTVTDLEDDYEVYDTEDYFSFVEYEKKCAADPSYRLPNINSTLQ